MPQQPDFLAHESGDHVAVAVRDVVPGERRVGYLDDTDSVDIQVSEPVPLGHKVALTDVAQGEQVIEYQLPIGICVRGDGRGGPITGGSRTPQNPAADGRGRSRLVHLVR